MPTIDEGMGGIQNTLYGLTLNVKTNRGNTYACQPIGYVYDVNGCLLVSIRSWSGYGTYEGKVKLTTEQTKQFHEALEYIKAERAEKR